jgi:hypothetical protein
MLTSKPVYEEAQENDMIGWLFKAPEKTNESNHLLLDYSTGAYVMIAFSAIAGLAYAGLAVLQTKRLFFSKAK